ncbi:hypothetical protein [Xanthomonas nasturtii]|uniref:hypothetical protein n=1 Tax=Xanthomonas nasturtii TaxID=1843581 RepID=UPI0020112E4F|nr:hypothetical protein [Xanthomonas nasturtii]MCL1528654.1 hypothetical protein [Xanthomonas nasturtii]MCL1536306.1 hypothetical protein [Xanthomonas nasturtii]MCL1545613.1 hypothetical protein [Xanthomonas nasturtii]
MSAEDNRVPVSPDPAMHWKRWEEWLDLVYQRIPVIRIQAQEDGTVLIRTRAYSEGPTVQRRMATEAGALRYANAWLLKWHGIAKCEINNNVESCRLQMATAEAVPANSPELDPATFTRRRRRR